MPKVTKAQMQEEINRLEGNNMFLRNELLKQDQTIKLYEKMAPVQHLNSYAIAHAQSADAMSHAIEALTRWIKSPQ